MSKLPILAAALRAAPMIALLVLAAPAHAQQTPDAAPAAQPAPPAAPTHQAGEPIDDGVRSTLAQYGSFVDNPTYGEVWVPTVTPEDWRPYAACHWVNDRKLGWYYDDKTAWGAIIHHYGRWAHDRDMGWVWIAGNEFSPGWVAWRTSPDYIGWAPLPPNDDLKAQGADAFNSAAFWTFMETPVFDRGCGGATIAAQRIPTLLQDTQPATDVARYESIGFIVLPDYVTAPLVDIAVTFKHWPHGYFEQMLLKWNFVWNVWDVKTTVNVVNCEKPHHPKPPHQTTAGCSGAGCAPPPPPSSHNPPPPPGQGYVPNCVGDRCGPQQTYTTVPVPVEPDTPPPPTYVPVPVPLPLPIPVGHRPPPTRCVGLNVQRDGRCDPPSGTVTMVPPGHELPVLPTGGCVGLAGHEFRRCLVSHHAPPPPDHRLPFQVNATATDTPLPIDVRRPNRPSHGELPTLTFHPAETATVNAHPVDPDRNHRPPLHIATSRPRPIEHPIFHVERPRPAFHAPVFHAAAFHPRPAFHPTFHPRPSFRPRPAFRAPRPVFHAAPRPVFHAAPRMVFHGGGGGGRRRR